MMELREISLRRGGRTILDRVSLELPAGTLTAVIGPNGAGKSSLLGIAAGTIAPNSGTVELDGRPLAAFGRAEIARRRAVMVQSAELVFPFRTVDVVMLGRSPHAGFSSRRRDVAVAEAVMAETGTLALADRNYATLSGGERQRVNLARALAQIWPENVAVTPPSRYLLLDEPTNNLDLAHQHAGLGAARALADRGLGVMAILHDPNLAAAYADRVAVLKDGRLAAVGTPEQVFAPALLAGIYAIEVHVVRHPASGRPVMLAAPGSAAAETSERRRASA